MTITELPEGVTHSHGEDFDPEKFIVATVEHPVTGESSSFTIPIEYKDRVVRYEHPDGTLGEWVNPDAAEDLDPETDDVIWDPVAGRNVARVTSAETGSASEAAVAGG